MRALIALLAAGPIAGMGLFAMTASEPAQSQSGRVCRGPGESVTTKFGEWFSPNVELNDQIRQQGKLVDGEVARKAIGVRLQIEARNPSGVPWTLILRSPSSEVLAILSEEDFRNGAGGNSTQWTGRLDSGQVSAELTGGPGVRLRFVSGMALPKDAGNVNVFSSLTADPGWKNPFDRTEVLYKKATQSVGMMVTGLKMPNAQNVLEKETWCCSGAMLTSDIFITNWHCGGVKGMADADYWSDQVRATTVIDLGWHEKSSARRQYSADSVLHVDQRLDYALLKVRPIVGPGAATGRATAVKVARSRPNTNDQIFIIHHAQCKPKLVSFNCRVKDASFRGWTDPADRQTGSDITHQCATEPGASGAPVFDENTGDLIALHHLGFEKATNGAQCRPDQLNKAVSMESIYADVQQARPALFAELTRNSQ